MLASGRGKLRALPLLVPELELTLNELVEPVEAPGVRVGGVVPS
jgi:hypothetical protein